MKVSRLKLVSAAAFTLLMGAVARAACEPVVCPAIAKICPQGQVACRVSPCNCALACSANCDTTEPLASEDGTLDGQDVQLAAASVQLMTPAESPEAAAAPGQFCGGIAGIPCPEGFVCKDVPGDGCNPEQGGADCPGRCRRAH